MPNLDRFSSGLPDYQEQEHAIIGNCICGEEIYMSSDVIYFNGEFYCSSNCFIKDIGAKKGEAFKFVG